LYAADPVRAVDSDVFSVPAGAQTLAQALLARHGDAVQAILLYGSCYRRSDDREGIVDLYLLVDGYRSVHGAGLAALANRILPPNVYFLETPLGDRVLRAKYAVLSLAALERGTGRRAFHPYLWGRFAQPTALLYARTEAVAARVHAALAEAAATFVARVVPMLPEEFDAQMLWQRGLLLSYRAELRAERPESAAYALYNAAPAYYARLTRAAMTRTPFVATIIGATEPVRYRVQLPPGSRLRSRLGWGGRRAVGKILSVLRLLKGLFTFRGGPDYILWKIQRHSGVTVEVTPSARRHPLLAAWAVAWRLYRRRAFR
jgi:hypothetical protein